MERLPEFLWNHPVLVSLFLITLGALSWTLLRRERGEISASEAVRLINDRNLLVLDVRTANAFANGHVVDALHIPSTELPQRLEELEKRRAKRPLLLFGSSLEQHAARKHLAEDCESYSLQGGALAWENASLPLIKGPKKPS